MDRSFVPAEESLHAMKRIVLALTALICFSVAGKASDISIPDGYVTLIKPTDFVEVSGTDDEGRPENFTIHNAKAISQFLELLTTDRFVAVPKNLKPNFKSRSSYDVRLSAHGA